MSEYSTMNTDAQAQQGPGFYVSPFGMDGESLGTGFWAASNLSERWLDVCVAFLHQHGLVFDSRWPEPLSHVRTKLTSASGAAIATFYVRDQIVSSILLLSGRSPAVDDDVAAMFTESLKRSSPSVGVSRSSRPGFQAILARKERPLMAVVAWPDPSVSDEDQDLVRELGLHLAGAFLLN